MASETNHPWCRDVSRDEAVRAAEDAAAVPAIQHRDLPDIVADLRERVARLEAAEKQAASTEAMRCMTKMRRERDDARAERDAAIRERDAAKEECERLGQIVSKYQETRQWDIEKIEDGCVRICFGDHHRALDCEWEYFIPASREADFKNQRSGAIRERDEARAECKMLLAERDEATGRCKMMLDRVAELEAAAAPAANAGGKQQEPMAWMYKGEAWFDGKIWHDRYETTKDEKVAKWKDMNAIPLYAAPQPPRGWLTAEERVLIESLRATFEQNADTLRPQGLGGHVDNCKRRVRLLDAILARETPPRVKVPSELMLCEARGVRIVYDAGKVKRAIRAAGGEVE